MTLSDVLEAGGTGRELDRAMIAFLRAGDQDRAAEIETIGRHNLWPAGLPMLKRVTAMTLSARLILADVVRREGTGELLKNYSA